MKFLRGEIAAPVFWYLAFTVGAPFAGAGGQLQRPGEYFHHAATIVAVVGALTATRIALARWTRGRPARGSLLRGGM